MNLPHADVAELADAQVSEACDGDIVEVQVLSSAPLLSNKQTSPFPRARFCFLILGTSGDPARIRRVSTYLRQGLAQALSSKKSKQVFRGIPRWELRKLTPLNRL